MTPRTPGKSYRGKNGNLSSMLFLSLTLHLIFITVIFVSIPTNSRHLTFGTTYSVQLVGSEAALPVSESSLLKDILQSKEKTDTIIIKHKINSIYSSPVKTQETNKLNIEKALSAIRQKVQDGSTTGGKTSSAAKSPISDAEANSQTDEYIGAVWSKVKQNWTIPQSLLPEKNITAIIDVRISRTGALEYAGIEKRSGNGYFDDSALRAVKKSSPFPPLPSWVRDRSIEIGIRFHSSELH